MPAAEKVIKSNYSRNISYRNLDGVFGVTTL